MSEPTATERLAQACEALGGKRRRYAEVQQRLGQYRSLAGPGVLVAGTPDDETSLRRELANLSSDIDYLETVAQTAQQAVRREEAQRTAPTPAANLLEALERQRAEACLDWAEQRPGAEARLVALEAKISQLRLEQERRQLAERERQRRAQQAQGPGGPSAA